MKLFSLTLMVMFLCLGTVTANNVQITNVTYDNDANQLTFDISWENSWRSGTDYHDAVWVFVKYSPNNSDNWYHADITNGSAASGLELLLQMDYKGVFVRNSASYSGDVAATSISLDLGTLNGPFPDIKVFGVEMVYVPQGAFYVGDNSSPSSLGSYSTVAGGINNSFQITSSGEINVGTTNGYLYSLAAANRPIANIPAAFPNGYDAFYCMKYEITMEQYKEFLNCLTRTQQNARTYTDISGTSVTNVFAVMDYSYISFRNNIRCESTLPATGPITFYNDLDNDGIYDESNDGQGIACQNINPDDLMAYLDWAGLRPMTDLEYEKACRGTSTPVAGEYAWGTTDLVEAATLSFSGQAGEIVTESGSGLANYNGTTTGPGPLRNGFAATSSSNRAQSGGSFYGIMELTGNISELVVSLEFNDANGLLFDGTLGDGELDSNGDQNAWTGMSYLKQRGGSYYTSIISISDRSGNTASWTGRNLINGGRGVR